MGPVDDPHAAVADAGNRALQFTVLDLLTAGKFHQHAAFRQIDGLSPNIAARTDDGREVAGQTIVPPPVAEFSLAQ
jgi:hypothetical protein